jgi:hypothetical protein
MRINRWVVCGRSLRLHYRAGVKTNIMKNLILLLFLLASALSFGQHYAIRDDSPRHSPQRIYILHADPYLILKLLSGDLNVSGIVEYSTFYNVQFGGWGGGRR